MSMLSDGVFITFPVGGVFQVSFGGVDLPGNMLTAVGTRPRIRF